MTIGQAHGGLLKSSIEEHKLIENQVLTPAEAQKLLNFSYNAPQPIEIQDLLSKVSRAVLAQMYPSAKAKSPAPRP
jgi:hypothetical protein